LRRSSAPYFLFLLLPQLSFGQTNRFEFTQPKMGSLFNIILYSKDSAQANQLAFSSFLLVDSLNHIFSDYDPESELNQLSASSGSGTWFKPSPVLWQILLQSKTAFEISGGAFDISIGSLTILWRKARKENKFPGEEEIKYNKQFVGFSNLLFDTSERRVQFIKKGMHLDLGGIAKGWIAQYVLNYLKTNGITSALVGAAGDITVAEPPPGKTGWNIGMNIPGSETELMKKTIELSNAAVSTSGDVYQYIMHNGKKYSHIIDPRTGFGVTYQRNATIIATDGITADWLATACSILPMWKCRQICRKMNAHFFISTIKKKKLKARHDEGFKKFLRSS
jgi:thiamine biosynthesis lipoprotein